MKHKFVVLKKQAGVTLMELIATLAIIALVVAGALALYTSASSSEAATSLTRDLHAIQAATQQLFQGQGTYGNPNTNLNGILVTAKKIPTTISVTQGNPPTLRHKLNGTVNIVSTGSSFTITLTSIPTEVCMPLMTGASGWSSVQVGTTNATPRVPPISPATAETDCKTGTTMVFTN